MKGMIQVYTGDGKGKTTAALGLALRALGAGLKVYIGQFIKSGDYSELKSLKKYKNQLTIEQYGIGCFIRGKPKSKDILLAKKGFNVVRGVLLSKKYDVVIIDEINVAQYLRLLSLKDVLALIRFKPKNVELILTGRRAHSKVIQQADLVTEMKEIKHYYKRGIKARRGIEH